MRSKKQPEYRQPCECGACPKIPRGRPPTLNECLAFYGHDGWFSPERVRALAVGHHVFAYVVAVNLKGWRKPRGWDGGRVALSQLRPKGKPITVEQYRRVIHDLMKGGTDGGD